MAFALGLMPAAPNVWVAVGLIGLLAVGQGLATPTLSALLSRTATRDVQGSTLGLGQSAAAAARAAGPAMGGSLFDAHFVAPFAAAAAAAAAAATALAVARATRITGRH